MTEASGGADRRRFPRVEIPLLVQIRYAATEAPRTVYSLNVSERGLFLDVDDGKPLGTRVFVQVTTRDGRNRVRGEGRVVRRENGGCGIELLGFDDEARRVLLGIMSDGEPVGESTGDDVSESRSGALRNDRLRP
jgi:hypothetical protein